MEVFRPCRFAAPEPCSYLPEKTCRFASFFADQVNGRELEDLLSTGWRAFGIHYFRPMCANCNECVPVRVMVHQFTPSKSQRRISEKNRDVRIEWGEPRYSEEAFIVYEAHSRVRFRKKTTREEFFNGFYLASCDSLQSSYFIGTELVAVGFLHHAIASLSSVYFVFHPAYSSRGLGIYSVLREIEYASHLELRYYYLGYCIADNRSMAYKGKFFPHEAYVWETGEWKVRYKK